MTALQQIREHSGAAGQSPVIEIRNVYKHIGKKTIVRNVSFDVYPGEIFGLLGPNGAGKTTLIRMLVGLMSISDGSMKVDGHDVRRTPDKALRSIGAIVENPEMYKFMSGYKNLLHFAKLVPGNGIDRYRILDVVSMVGLDNRIHDKVKTYSLGMRQRLGVAQALMHKPKVLILDEPTNGLDPAGIRELRDQLKTLAREEGIAVIVSSHLLSEMELMCDRVGVIQQGVLIGIQQVTEENTPEHAVPILFQVDSQEAARKVIALAFDGLVVDSDPLGILVTTSAGCIADINAKLVAGGVRVSGISIQAKSLEDKFMEMTGRP
ncbi:ABC transporter ATP-binding protein [Paenibacillus sp. GCM10012303]|uniref:ABC transporter ATP-binding protein n=1 Tax=Paenibacillus sp. GCM10012303 TaxID=3317340 RepID=UPI00361390EF